MDRKPKPLRGMKANSEYSRLPERALFDGAPKGRYPLFKDGDTWMGTEDGLERAKVPGVANA